jgi:hypothetical protein
VDAGGSWALTEFDASSDPILGRTKFMATDRLGSVFVAYSTSGRAAIVWRRVPAPVWSLSLALGTETTGLAVDGLGGAYLRGADPSSSPPAERLAHVLSTGVLDPVWPTDGRSLPPSSSPMAPSGLLPDGAAGCLYPWTTATPAGTELRLQHLDLSGDVHSGWPDAGFIVRDGPGLADGWRWGDGGPQGSFVVWSDLRSGERDIYAQRIGLTGVVATQLLGAEGVWRDGAARLSWRIRNSRAADFVVERSTDGVEWQALGAPGPGRGPDQLEFVDGERLPSPRRHYHLRELSTGWVGGELQVDAGPRALRLEAVAPPPGGREWSLALEGLGSGPVELAIWDAQGRMLAMRKMDTTAGKVCVALRELGTLPTGMLWARARQAGAQAVARVPNLR